LFKMKDASTVYVGNKPPMAYVMALITAFRDTGTDIVVLKARGRAISRTVDVVEIARNRYLNDVSVEKIEIGSEQMPTDDGRTRGVSTIAITLRRGGKAVEKAEAPPEPKIQPEAKPPPKDETPPEAKIQPEPEAQPEAKPPPKDETPPEAKIQLEAQPEAKPPSKDKVPPVEETPREEVSLSDLKGVGKKTEEKLREAGYKSPRSIARAKASTLSGKTGLSEKVASKLIDAARELLK
jgi:DNA-binding protein